MPNSNPKPMTIYTARHRGRSDKVVYPDWRGINCAEDLRQAVAWDHVCAEYQGNLRGIKNFVRADCLPMDLDNDHSDRPEDWKTLEDIRAAFPGVPFYAVPSRSHMKPKKEGKTGKVYGPRPRYHVYFPIDEMTSAKAYRAAKAQTRSRFPWFDEGAADAARFLYGVEAPEVTTVQGDEGKTLTALLGPLEAPAAQEDKSPARGIAGGVIPQGQRNGTLHDYAVKLLRRYGDSDGRARAAYDEYTAKCDPPLEDTEVETIWASAAKFFRDEIATAVGYLSPQEYELREFAPELLPEDFTDVGEAECLATLYENRMRYSDATEWLIYDGRRWIESNALARALVHKLTKRQLKKARHMAGEAADAIMKAREAGNEQAERRAEDEKARADQFHKFARQYQRSARISATLTEAAPYLPIEVEDLDRNAFLLNTPAGTVNLRSGETRPHRPEDYCTRMTACAPGSEGMEIFAEFLDRVTCGDAQLREYLQAIAGMFTVGAVFRECLIIAYGSGGNGKSTLFNLLAYVLGDYAGGLSAETLTMNCRKNKSPEYAELRGRRLVIAAELEEGMRFDTAVIKKLCSTDPIFAEKKFKAPFTFIPSHTLVLYTNHLPRVGTVDRGTWDRLVVVPFNASFRGQADEVLNYGQYLFEHAGGAVLQWMIDGARKFIEARFRIPLPDCVRAAVEEYRADNDWLQQFLDNCCDVEPTYRQPSGELYAHYRQYCAQTGEYTRHAADFKQALLDNGFEFRKTMTGNFYFGLRLTASAWMYTGGFVPAVGDMEGNGG